MERTNTSTSQKKKHPFWDKHTVLGTALLIILSYIVISFPPSIVISVFCVVTGSMDKVNDALMFGIIPMSLITLLIYWLWFRPEFRGVLFRGFARTLRLCPVILLFWLLVCLPDFLNGRFPQTFNLTVFSIALSAGFSEEVAFRGLPLSYLKRQLRSEKQIPLIVIVTGAVFGLFHIFNILVGASVSASIVQSISAVSIGIFLGAVFMRGGNLLVPILLHSLHDVLMLSFSEADEVSAVLSEEATSGDILIAAVSIALAAFGFFLIRKSKRGEICQMWAETWSQSTESQPEIPAQPVNTMEV